MKRFFIFAVAAALAAGMTNSAWSQGGQSGGGSTSGGAGASGGAGTSGAAGTRGTAGAAGSAGTTGTAGTVGVGAQGRARAAGQAQAGAAQQQSAAAQAQLNARGQAGTQFGGVSQNPWFANPSVRRQLNLTDRQFNQLNRAYQNAWNRYNTSIQGMANQRGRATQGVVGQGRNTAAAQRAQRLQEFENRFDIDDTNTGPGNAAAQRRQRLEEFQERFDTDDDAAERVERAARQAQRAQRQQQLQDRRDNGQVTVNRRAATGVETAAAQRQQRLQEFENRFRTDFNQALDQTLTDSQLRQRFDQLNLQFMGLEAFSDPRVQQQLNLTEVQRRELLRLAAEWRRDLNELRRTSRTDPTLTQQQFIELRTRYWNLVNQVLTPVQQQTFTRLMGERFDFPVALFLRPDGTVTAEAGNATQLDADQRAVQPTVRPGTAEQRTRELRR